MRSLIRKLLRPSAKYSVLALTGTGLVLGVAAVIGFEASMRATNTEAFCTSCHEMAVNPSAQLQETSHFANPSGVHATCADCHVPKEFVPKMIRKIQASREVWGHFTGIIDTPEKYAAHAPVMKAREIARLRASDSRECRNCHSIDRMLPGSQTAKARQYHQAMERQGKTCIDCHSGIAHPRNIPGAVAGR